MGETFGRSVRAVRCREGVIDIDVAVGCKCCNEFWIVLFFALVEAGVFKKQNIAVFECLHCRLGFIANAIFGKMHSVTKHFCERLDDVFQGVFVRRNAFWTAEMSEQDDFGTLLRQFRNGWNNTFDTGEVGYLAVSHRHVEVNANQNAF